MQSFLLFFLTLLFTHSVQAELMGMVIGRSARITSHSSASIEAGASWYTHQLQWSAVRFNFKPSSNLTLYVDYAKMRARKLPVNASLNSGFVGSGAGVGIFFGIPDFLLSYDIAFKGAYHAAVIDNVRTAGSTRQIDLALHQRQLNAEFILSPIDPLFDNGLSWYGTFGHVSTDAQTRLESVPLSMSNTVKYRKKSGWALGAGVVKPIKYGSLFAGLTWLAGDPLLGGGIRYSF